MSEAENRKTPDPEADALREPEVYEDENGVSRCAICGAPVRERKELLDFMGVRREFLVEDACPCRTAWREAQERDRKRKFKAARALRDWEASRFYNPNLREMTFSRDDAGDSAAARICKNYAENWARMRKENCGLLLMGPVGTGKTYYAAALMNRLMSGGVTCALVSAPRLVSECMNGQSAEVLRELNRFEFLILDDLGAERDTDFALEQIELFTDARYASGKLLAVTTNLTKAELDDRSDRRRARIYDRVREMACVPVLLNGKSRRGDIARDKARRMRELLGAGA